MRALLLIALLLPAGAARAADRMPVVATMSILGDLVARVGGAAVSVTTLVPPDGDAHTYQPRPADLIALRAARVVVVNGLGLEGWMDRLPSAAGGHAVRVVASAGVTPRRFTEDGRSVTDPHAWQDPRNGVRYVRAIEAGLAAADPAHAEGYHVRADRLAAEIDATDAWIMATLADIAPERRRIVTSHDAFGYYGARTGIAFIGVQGISTDAEPGARDIATLVGQIRRQHIAAVFVEKMTDPRVAATVAREAGVRVGSAVYSDALSPPGGPADSYVAMLRHNTTLFAEALK